MIIVVKLLILKSPFQSIQRLRDNKYPTVGQSWRRNWEHVIPFFVFLEGIRRIIYTTNAIESLNMRLRKITKNRDHFPGDDSASKLLYLPLRKLRNWACAHKISSFVSLSLDGRRLVLTINDTALLYGCYVLVTYVAAQPARPHFSFTLSQIFTSGLTIVTIVIVYPKSNVSCKLF